MNKEEEELHSFLFNYGVKNLEKENYILRMAIRATQVLHPSYGSFLKAYREAKENNLRVYPLHDPNTLNVGFLVQHKNGFGTTFNIIKLSDYKVKDQVEYIKELVTIKSLVE